MQVDMHYYGVYALATVAGLPGEIAKRIAEASQFVDDYTEEADIETSDGALIAYWPSGHGMVCDATLDVASLNGADPHRVWVPFHFLPGDGEGTYGVRMRCRKDSGVAQEVLENVLAKSTAEFAPELVGIVAHIYADTFSHYGFSGLRSTANHIDQKQIDLQVNDDSVAQYIWNKARGYFGALSGIVAEDATRGLGHAAVADLPDRPYLSWHFTYEDGTDPGPRDNQATYREACEKLFKFFCNFNTKVAADGKSTDQHSFDDIRNVVSNIIAFEGKTGDRIKQWQRAASSGKLGFSFPIPPYSENQICSELNGIKHQSIDAARSSRICKFTWAVEVMRNMILNEILPRHGLFG